MHWLTFDSSTHWYIMNEMKIAGIVMLVLAGVSVFVGIERYQANANAVNAMNQMGGGMFRAMTGGNELKPAVPASTKYSLLAALILGGGGAYCLLNEKPGRHRHKDTRFPEKPNFPNDSPE